jgi:hypothetical protein
MSAFDVMTFGVYPRPFAPMRDCEREVKQHLYETPSMDICFPFRSKVLSLAILRSAD